MLHYLPFNLSHLFIFNLIAAPVKFENMDSVFVSATFTSTDAGVELTGMYSQRVAGANTGFMSAPKVIYLRPFKKTELQPSDKIVNGTAVVVHIEKDKRFYLKLKKHTTVKNYKTGRITPNSCSNTPLQPLTYLMRIITFVLAYKTNNLSKAKHGKINTTFSNTLAINKTLFAFLSTKNKYFEKTF